MDTNAAGDQRHSSFVVYFLSMILMGKNCSTPCNEFVVHLIYILFL